MSERMTPKEKIFRNWQNKYPNNFPKNRDLCSYVKFEITGKVKCVGDNCVGLGWEEGPMDTIIESQNVRYNDLLWITSRLCPVLLYMFGKREMNIQMITRAKITDKGTNGVSPGGPPTKLVPNNPENEFGCYYLTEKFVFQT
ncbi:MAG: hypothetical protein Q7R95_04170 [bacterium]|nr:hypothetical protein [bacterium]